MEIEKIKRIIVTQKEEIEERFKKLKIIDREVNKDKLRKFLSHPNVLVILGVRRCGKSTFSLQLYEKNNYGYINFDDERLADFSVKDFDKLLQGFYELYGEIDQIILDEPHNVDKWELFVNRLRRTKKVIITGSNSKLLAGELADRLTGRYIDFTLFPFSFREFLRYKEIKITNEDFYLTSKIALIKKSLSEYLEIGGFPESYILGKEIISRIFFDILEKDIIKRIKVRKEAIFKEFAKYLISNFSNEITFSKLKNIFEVKDVHTIRNWIGGMQNTYLIQILNRFSPKLKEQILAPKKIYCIDTGIINTIGFKLSENFGKLMENLVAIELFRRKSYWFNNREIYYWKDYYQNEVDFVIKEGLDIKQLIQVTYASSKDEINQREIKALVKASELLKCKDLLIITWDYEDEIKVNSKTIKCIPLWKWLLNI